MAIDINSQQLFGKLVPFSLGDISPVRDIRDVRNVAFVTQILLQKLDKLILSETESFVD